MYCTQREQINSQEPTVAKKRKVTCSICGNEGHKANNQKYHPDIQPNAKTVTVRTTKKSAAQLPNRNSGEIDDEEEAPELLNDSEDEDSDGVGVQCFI